VEVRAHLDGTIAGIADFERDHRLSAIERDRRRVAHEAGDPRERACRHWIGACTVTSRLPSVNTASTCTMSTSSATPSITSALVSTERAALITSSIVNPLRAPSSALAEITDTASG